MASAAGRMATGSTVGRPDLQSIGRKRPCPGGGALLRAHQPLQHPLAAENGVEHRVRPSASTAGRVNNPARSSAGKVTGRISIDSRRGPKLRCTRRR